MAILEITQWVDARGLTCPMPILSMAQALRTIPSGAAVELVATDPGAVKDVPAWCLATGNQLMALTSDGAVYHFVIRRP
jgi:tRNA 2-thiouridine synthesizing protein A